MAHQRPSVRRVRSPITGHVIGQPMSPPTDLHLWVTRAACAGQDPNRWQGDRPDRVALEICRTCPVLERCAVVARTVGASGVWGGQFLKNGRPVRRPRRPNGSAAQPAAQAAVEPADGPATTEDEAPAARAG